MTETPVLTSFQKAQSERYSFQFKMPSTWAIFTISEDGNFHCHSDMGDFAYHWTAFRPSRPSGEPHDPNDFKRFLIGLEKDSDYLLKKVALEPRVFQKELTVKHWKQEVCRLRREGASKEWSRVAWDTLSSFESSPIEEYEMKRELLDMASEDFVLNADSINYGIYDYSPQCKFFKAYFYPAFVKSLKDELGIPA